MDTAQQLIDDIRVGKETALENLYIQERKPFLVWAQKYFQCSPNDAKELFQISILILYDNIMMGKLVEINCAVKSYLCAVAKNKWKEWQRAKNRIHSIDNGYLLHLIDEEESRHFSEKMIGDLGKGLQRLGDPCQKLLEAYYYKKWSMHQICLSMGYKNPDTAKNLKYKCLQRLKKMMDHYLTKNHYVPQSTQK